MASEIYIMNRAASKLGADRFTDRSDTNSKAASEIDACFDSVRDAELRAHTWRFSLARAALSPLVTVPPFGFTLEYQLPTDCLRVIQVGDYYWTSLSDYRGTDESPYSVEGRKLLTNLPAPLNIRYVRKMDDTDAEQFDGIFVELLACRVAIETCEAITGSTSKKDSLAADYKDRLMEALQANDLEIPPTAPPDDTWMATRVGS